MEFGVFLVFMCRYVGILLWGLWGVHRGYGGVFSIIVVVIS